MPEGGELSPAQAAVVDRIGSLIGGGEHGAILVDGPTAGGKTAVYAEALRAALSAGRGGLVLVPEIALALPLLERLAHDLPVEVAVLHSGLSEGERADEWRRIRSGEARVVVGTRLAVLAPLADPGVIIVDEEHDASYKSDRTPRYQARDVALELGRLASVPVILGSATPDVTSVGRARGGEFERFALPERISGAPPRVEIVDLRAELAAGNKGLLSEPLVDALGALDRSAGDRAILVINRRGSASVVVCRDCGYVQICPECQRPLVFHAAAMALRCHHCGATAPSHGAARRATRRASVTWAAARNGSNARSGCASRKCESIGWTATWLRDAAGRRGSWMRSPMESWTCSWAHRLLPRVWMCRRSPWSASSQPTSR
jgi:primosomal protein N' (replication factor Y)